MKRPKKPILAILTLVIAIYAGVVVGYNIKPVEYAPKASAKTATVIQKVSKPDVYQLWTLVNKQRAENSLAPLRLDSRLNNSAAAKCKDMVSQNYWAHDAPDGTTPWYFITATYGSYTSLGENLAYGINESDGVVDKWMHSPEHRKNIVDPLYTDEGFAVCHSANFIGHGDQYIVVQHLAAK